MTEVEIDGEQYVKLESESQRTAIVVCDRGFVLVGNISTDDNYLTIYNCSNVRRWGTSRGLGELATNGPLENTKLDPQPTTKVHELQVVQIIDCEESKWNL